MKNFFFFLLILINGSAYSQIEVLNDDMSSDRGNFVVSKESDYETGYKDGHYTMKMKKDINYWTYNYVNLEPNEDNFTIEATMELKKGKPSTYYGLAIAIYNDQSDYVSFYMNNEGNFFITHYYASDYHSIASVQKNSAIKTSGPQVLKVERKFNVCTYYINGVKVHSDANRSYYGKGFGLQVYGKGEVWVDNVKVTKEKKNYHLVDNAVIGRKKENLGRNVNSTYGDFAPLISADGKTLYFIRSESPDNIGGGKQDVWYSTLDANGNWGPAKNLGAPINNSSHNFMVNITPDNNKMYVGNIYDENGNYLSQGISVSTKTTNGWGMPKGLTIKNFNNENDYVDYFPDLSNRFIIMAIENSQSLGEKDFFISFIEKDGTYTTPLHMGSVINTVGDEWGPVLAADGKTLYFCSNGLDCYGSTDVFMTTRLDDTWTNWSTPLNMGPEINTDERDGQISISADGKYGYVSTSYGVTDKSEDIFRFELGTSKPDPVVLIYGKVLNSKTNIPLSASINYNNLQDNVMMGTAISDVNDGSYKIILPIGKMYSFLAEKEGFYPISENIDLTNIKEYTEIKRDLLLAPIDIGEVIRLNNVFFEYDKAELKKESEAELNRLSEFLNKNPNIQIQISGHTDDKGSDTYNQSLSQNRVNSVVKYLESKGINGSRMKGIGYGESKPVASNATEDGRALNRRVEFVVLKK